VLTPRPWLTPTPSTSSSPEGLWFDSWSGEPTDHRPTLPLPIKCKWLTRWVERLLPSLRPPWHHKLGPPPRGQCLPCPSPPTPQQLQCWWPSLLKARDQCRHPVAPTSCPLGPCPCQGWRQLAATTAAACCHSSTSSSSTLWLTALPGHSSSSKTPTTGTSTRVQKDMFFETLSFSHSLALMEEVSAALGTKKVQCWTIKKRVCIRRKILLLYQYFLNFGLRKLKGKKPMHLYHEEKIQVPKFAL